MSAQGRNQSREPRAFVVTGHVHFVEDIPAHRTKVVAFDRDLRTEQPLGEAQTDRNGTRVNRRADPQRSRP